MPQNQPSAFGSDPAAASHASRKKILIIIGVVLLVLSIGGAGLSYWAIQNRNKQLAIAAKIEAQRQAKAKAEAEARKGTVSDLHASLDTEVKEVKDQNDRAIYNAGDSLKREAEAALTVGTGNENGI